MASTQAAARALEVLRARRAWARLEAALGVLEREVPLALVVDALTPLHTWRQTLYRGRLLDATAAGPG